MVDAASELATRLQRLNPLTLTVVRTVFEGELTARYQQRH